MRVAAISDERTRIYDDKEETKAERKHKSDPVSATATRTDGVGHAHRKNPSSSSSSSAKPPKHENNPHRVLPKRYYYGSLSELAKAAADVDSDEIDDHDDENNGNTSAKSKRKHSSDTIKKSSLSPRGLPSPPPTATEPSKNSGKFSENTKHVKASSIQNTARSKRGRKPKPREPEPGPEQENAPVASDIESEEIDENTKKEDTSAKRKREIKSKKASSPTQRKSRKSDSSKTGGKTVHNIVQAPAEIIPPGTIGKTTMAFLGQLSKKECNDRDWLRLHDPVYRHAYKNWTDFLDYLTPLTIERADENLPYLPARDVVYRLARDIRFTNDKTPYKTYFAATFSRSGRKTQFAQYFLQIAPGKSILAVGKWEPDKNQTHAFRQHILRSSTNFRAILSEPDFVDKFGPPQPGKKERPPKNHSVFEAHDMLKGSPKIMGLTNDHPDMDLLKLRSIYAVHRFSDDEVLSDTFVDGILSVMKAGEPLVNALNNIFYPDNS